MQPAAIDEMFARWQARDPAPATELVHATPFQLLVAVVLSAQATDAAVNRVTARLFRVAGTPAALATLGAAGIKPYIASLGLSNAKSVYVAALSQQVAASAGELPTDRAGLEALPGVGRKTANVVLNAVFGLPTLAVDTHVFRVANRTGLAPGADVRRVETALLERIPAAYLFHAHHWLLLHGRYVCTARRPACPDCLIRDLCLFEDKTPGDPLTRR